MSASSTTSLGGRRALFPWSDSDGLTAPLRDPELWGEVFAHPEDQKAVRRAGRKVDLGALSIGALCVQLLQTKHGRQVFERELKRVLLRIPDPLTTFVPGRLDIALKRRGFVLPPDLYGGAGANASLNIAALGARPASLRDWEPSTILLAVSPHAMRQQHGRERILAALRADPKIAAVLESEAIAIEPPKDVRTVADHEHPSTEVTREGTQCSDANVPATAAIELEAHNPEEHRPEQAQELGTRTLSDLGALISQLGRDPDSLRSLVQLRDGLRHCLSAVEERAGSIHERQSRIAAQLATLRMKPWMRARIPADDITSVDDREPVPVIEARLTNIDETVSDIFALCARVEELATRVDESIPAVPVTAYNLSSLRAWLSDQAEIYEVQLSLLAENEARLNGLLQELSLATPDSAVRIVRSSVAEVILLGRVLAGDSSCLGRHSEVKHRLEGLSPSRRCLGLLLATAWHTSAAKAKPLVQAIGRRIDQGDDVGDCVKFLVPGWWESIVDAASQIAFPLVARAVATAIVSEDGTGIDYIAPCVGNPGVHRELRDFIAALRDARNRGELAGLRNALGDTASIGRRASDAARARARVLEAIQRQPGMTGHYHKLRVDARVHFLLPLHEWIVLDDAEGALAQWADSGSVEEMVEQTRRSYDRREELTSSHLDQLANYIKELDVSLRGWVRLATPTTPATLRHVSSSWKSLLGEAGARPAGPVATLTRVVQEVLAWDGLAADRAAGYVESPQCLENGDEFALMMPNPITGAHMTWSYPQAVKRGQVDLHLLFVEVLRTELGQPALSLREAMEHYLTTAQWEIAHAGAAGDADLEHLVTSWMERRREEIRVSHAELLRSAEDARNDDEYIDLALSYYTEAAQALDSDKIAWALKSLEEQLRRFRLERDPRRAALVELLSEAGERVISGETVEQLAARLEALRTRSVERRVHLDELSSLDGLPATLREAWQSTVRRLDRPALWPSPSTAQALAEAIDVFKRYLVGQSEGVADDPATVNLLVSRFEQWLPAQLSAAVQSNGEHVYQTIQGVAREIRRFCPPTKILRMLGETSIPQPSRVLPPTEPPPLGHVDAVKSALAGASAQAAVRTASPSDTVAEIRRVLRSSVPADTASRQVSTSDELTRLVASADWTSLLSRTAPALLRPGVRNDRLSGEEVLFAVALARTNEVAAVSHYILGVLGIVGNPDAEYVLRPEQRTRFLVDTIAVIAGVEHTGAIHTADVLATALEHLSQLPGTDPAIGHASQLFARLGMLADRRGMPASVTLVYLLWEVFKGLQSNAGPRSHLLYLLYRLRQHDVLKHLAGEAKPFDAELIQCITAFDRSESAPEVRPRTLQISAAIRERSKGRNKPWTLLFARLEAGFAADDGAEALQVVLVTSLVDTDTDGNVTLQVQLTPPFHDAPVQLTIDVGGEQRTLLQDDEPLLKEKTVAVVIDGSRVGPPDEESRVPYRITGHTIRGNRIDLRDAWTLVPRRAERVERLTNADIQRAWPGAKGDPVTQKDPTVFGREAERRQLYAQLIDGDRPQSVMIFGQRRVGKTSLLWQMIDELPPRRGAVTGAFVDVSGVDPAGTSYARAFVSHICAALDYDERNEPIRRELQRQAGERIEISKLLRGLKVDNVYYALERLTDRLRDLSRGVIHHLALFVDEFDRFVEPLLSGNREEVNGLLWQIRQVAQQSRKVALVLAGSGLQRLLSDNYNSALFGSIAQLDIGPFRFGKDDSADNAAIERTFLPPEVRDRLCRPGDLRALVETAYELTRGYPFYLAMLGYSAALLSPGFRLTPGMLHRAADEMVRGTVPNLTWRIDAGNFYLHIFETAARLPARKQAVVKLLLAFIATQTSRDYPWLSLEVIDLADVPKVAEDDRREALSFLANEHVIEIDLRPGRVRILVPLTAAAIRENALSIREEALAELKPSNAGVAP